MATTVISADNADGEYVHSHFMYLFAPRPTTLYVYGTWGGAAVDIQVSPDGQNWFDASYYVSTDLNTITSGQITANKAIRLHGTFSHIKIVVSNVGTTSLNAVVM